MKQGGWLARPRKQVPVALSDGGGNVQHDLTGMLNEERRSGIGTAHFASGKLSQTLQG